MNMKISDKGALHLMKSEAIVLTWYRDSKGIWTLGVGHTDSAGEPKRAANPSLVLSLVEALELFKRDLGKYEKRVNDALGGAKVTQAQFDALVSFDYNSGGIFKAALTKHIRSGDFDKAADAFMGWVKPPEIKGRREGEQTLFKTGDYGDLSKVPVYAKKPGKATLISTANLLGGDPLAVPEKNARDLSQALSTLGYDTTVGTTNAVMKLQKDHKLRVDGIAGPLTWATIDGLLAKLKTEPAAAEPAAGAAEPVVVPIAIPIAPSSPKGEEGVLLVVASVQALLRAKGYPEVGEADNVFGERTRNAILAFEADNGLPLTGAVSDKLLAQLVKAPMRQVADARGNATAKDLKAKGDTPVVVGDWFRKIGMGVIAATGLGTVFEGSASFDQITSSINNVQRLIALLGTFSPWLLLGAGGIIAFIFGGRIVRQQVAAYREGRVL